jgi:hypothetical protein
MRKARYIAVYRVSSTAFDTCRTQVYPPLKGSPAPLGKYRASPRDDADIRSMPSRKWEFKGDENK